MKRIALTSLVGLASSLVFFGFVFMLMDSPGPPSRLSFWMLMSGLMLAMAMMLTTVIAIIWRALGAE